MTRFAILLGGDVTPTERLKRQVKGARCIAADSGIAHATVLQLAPELWVGDFDSSGTELEQAFKHVPRVVHPSDKAATDGELAVEEALKRGATSLLLVGGFGGQFDHMLAHGTMMLALAEKGIAVFTSSGHEEAYPLLGALQLTGLARDTRLSVIGMTRLAALSIKGVRWPLNDREVPFGSSLTMSNATVGDVELELRGGKALVLVYP
jgi:thiamine pyrophosphokinase